MRWKPAIFDRSRPAVRATEWGALAALVVMLFSYFVLFDGWSNLSLHGADLFSLSRCDFQRSADLRWSIGLGVIAGAIVYVRIVLRSIKSNGLKLEPVDLDGEANFPGLHLFGVCSKNALPAAQLPVIKPGSGDTQAPTAKRQVLDAFIRASDPAWGHRISLPDGFVPLRDNRTGKDQHEPVADLSDALKRYAEYYNGTDQWSRCGGPSFANRLNWFRKRKLDDLLENGALKNVISIDETIQDLLQALCDRFSVDVVTQSGLLCKSAGRDLHPPLALLQDAAMYPHYDQDDFPVALSHSLSPILGVDCDDVVWDRREIYRAGKDAGDLYLTSGIYHAAHLRCRQHHAVAIHPHVWAYPELARLWPLPRMLAEKMMYGSDWTGRRTIEQFSHWLAGQLRNAGIRRIRYDLAPHYPMLFGRDTYVHRLAPQFLFRHYIRNYLSPCLKGAGIEVVHPWSLPWQVFKSGQGVPSTAGSPDHILEHSLFDHEGESAFLGIAEYIVPPAEAAIELTVDSSTTEPSQSGIDGQPDYSMVQREDGGWDITFGSERGSFKNIAGIRFVAAMLQHPDDTIDAKYLYDCFGEREGPPGTWVSADDKFIPLDALARAGESAEMYELSRTMLPTELSRADLPLSWRTKPRLVLDRLKNQLEDVEGRIAEFGSTYTPGEDTNEHDALVSQQKKLRGQIRIVQTLCTTDPTAQKIGRVLRYFVQAATRSGMPMLARYVRETMSPFESLRLGFKPALGELKGVTWSIQWLDRR
mgnify:CR=1 FL=1